MRFSRPPRRPLPESIIPMINVVFLLLIFFLMSARLAPAPPAKVEVPLAISDQRATADTVLYLAEDGLAMGDLRGDAVWQMLAALDADHVVTLRADARLSASEVAKTLARLAGLGVTQVALAVRDK